MAQFKHEDNDFSRRFEKISADIESYKKAIDDAQNALDAAERELNELLDSEYHDDLMEIVLQSEEAEDDWYNSSQYESEADVARGEGFYIDDDGHWRLLDDDDF